MIQSEDLACLLSQSWPNVNIMSGFMKAGIYPLNPGQITDGQTGPSQFFTKLEDGRSKPAAAADSALSDGTSVSTMVTRAGSDGSEAKPTSQMTISLKFCPFQV